MTKNQYSTSMMNFVQDASSSRRAAGRVCLNLFMFADTEHNRVILLVCCNKKRWEGNWPTDDKFRLDGSVLSKIA